MFGLGILAPLFAMAGIVGASIPLILHLLNRERARRLVFGTIRFIQMSHQTNVRRHKLKRLLLLLMRILMLALLGFAFARPFFAEAPIIAQKTGGKRNAIIILDTSYSMQYEKVFENAKREGIKILDELDATDAACLMLSSDDGRVVAPLGSEFPHIRSALNDAEATYKPTDYLDALQTADEILASIPIGEKQVYLIADMQKRGWENFIETDKLNPDVQIQFIDVHPEQPHNLAITDLNVPPVILSRRSPLYGLRPEQKASYLVARVRNFSDTAVENLPVRLFIDGNMIHTVQLDIEPDDLADAAFRVANFDSGQDEATHTGWVELPEDSLGADNKRYFTLQSLRSIKVHAVSDKPRTQNPNQNLHGQTIETFFMKRALTAGSDAVPIDFTESSSVPGATTLNRTDVLILANVAQLSSNEAERVAAYVASGGGLIVTVGDNIDADVYEQRLGGEIGLMPCNFVRPVGEAFDRQQFRVLATVKYEHPIFAPFKEPNHGDFGKARFYRIFQAVPTGTTTVVIASYDDGSPALFEKPYGNLGRVLCFTSTIDREWNDLPIRAVYLPFLHESIKYLALKDAETLPDYRVGDTIELKVSETEKARITRNGEIAIFNPNNVETRYRHGSPTESEVTSPLQGISSTDMAPLRGASSEEETSFEALQRRAMSIGGAMSIENTPQKSVLYTDTAIPGIYSVHRSGTEVTDYFVANVDTSESDLAARDVEELTSMLKGTADELVENKPMAELVAQYNEDVEKNQNVWIYLMLAVFALAITEMFLANRF